MYLAIPIWLKKWQEIIFSSVKIAYACSYAKWGECEGGLSALAKTHGKRFCNDVVQSTKWSTKSHKDCTLLCTLLKLQIVVLPILCSNCVSLFMKGFFQALLALGMPALWDAQEEISSVVLWVRYKYHLSVIIF